MILLHLVLDGDHLRSNSCQGGAWIELLANSGNKVPPWRSKIWSEILSILRCP